MIEGPVRELPKRLRLTGFRAFILRGNVVDLAVGIVIGSAFTALVNALVSDFITPLIGIPLKSAGEFAQRHWDYGGAKFLYGDFLNKALTLMVVGAALYYLVVLPVNSLMERFRTEPDVASTTKTCPECRSQVPVQATRCAFCTVVLPPAPGGGGSDGDAAGPGPVSPAPAGAPPTR